MKEEKYQDNHEQLEDAYGAYILTERGMVYKRFEEMSISEQLLGFKL
jgi:hypothetical protein